MKYFIIIAILFTRINKDNDNDNDKKNYHVVISLPLI